MAGYLASAVERARRLLSWVRKFLRARRAQRLSFALGVVLILYGLVEIFFCHVSSKANSWEACAPRCDFVL